MLFRYAAPNCSCQIMLQEALPSEFLLKLFVFNVFFILKESAVIVITASTIEKTIVGFQFLIRDVHYYADVVKTIKMVSKQHISAGLL